MELNTVIKTGTWSDAADRINSNLVRLPLKSKNKIKQHPQQGAVSYYRGIEGCYTIPGCR